MTRSHAGYPATNKPSLVIDEVERAARALCRYDIGIKRRHDTDAAELTAMMPSAVDMHWREYEQAAKLALGDLERRVKDEASSADMYRNAWLREIGGRVFRKSHDIDALVLTTRHIYSWYRYGVAHLGFADSRDKSPPRPRMMVEADIAGSSSSSTARPAA